MKFTKSNKPSDIPFGIYDIDPDYMKSVYKGLEKIESPDTHNICCGPIYHAETDDGQPVDMFVPLNLDMAHFYPIYYADTKREPIDRRLPSCTEKELKEMYKAEYEAFGFMPKIVTGEEYLRKEFRQEWIRSKFLFRQIVPVTNRKYLTKNNHNPVYTDLVTKSKELIELLAIYAIEHGSAHRMPPRTTAGNFKVKYEKYNGKPTVPFGFYYIDKDYIKSLKVKDNLVLDPNITNRYCGPVYCGLHNNIVTNFYVPIDPARSETLLLNLDPCDESYVYDDDFDFKKIIPCPDNYLMSDEIYKRLAFKYDESCIFAIQKSADKLMKRFNAVK